MVKMVAISRRENARGIPNGIRQDAEMFFPLLICEAPRLIQDSRVYPKLISVNTTPDRCIRETHVMNNPSSTTCFPRFAAELHSACQTGTVALRMPIPKPMMVRPTMNCANPKDEVHSASPMRVNVAARKMLLRRPRMFPIFMQAKDPTRAPSTKVPTTTP